MAKCLVIGGGFAGLSAAVYLSNDNHEVTLLEASPKLGGRAYSFEYDEEKCVIDNGQHILMGCYLFTLEFLELIGANHLVEIQQNLNINFAAKEGKKYKLDTGNVTYPFNILAALKDYEALTSSEKVSVVKLFLKIAVANPQHYADISTEEFLRQNHQSKNSVDALWEVIHVGTMNCKLRESSAAIFLRVIKEIFFTVDDSTKIVLPKVGLSELYCEKSREFIENNHGRVILSERVTEVIYNKDSGKAEKVVTSKNTYDEFDFLVLAAPPYQTAKLTYQSFTERIPDYNFSPILNIHLWFDSNPFNEKFYGLIDSRIHWLFNHGSHVTLITSAADELIDLPDDEIIGIAMVELKKYFDEFETIKLKHHLIIKEKRATFIPAIENSIERSKFENNFGNTVFAGDWTNTGLPATIEGAVKSGRFAADKISEFVTKKAF